MKFLSPKKTIQILSIIGITFLAWSFSYNAELTALEAMTIYHKENLNRFENQLAKLNNAVALFKENKKTVDEVKTEFIKARADYKQTEFLLEYFGGQAVKDHINGAPLPKIERNSPDMLVLEPHGLQVIEEILFADDGVDNKEELFSETQRILRKYREINAFQQKQIITERNLFEAARLELIRIVALGITGFDTPGSGNALEDAKNALRPLLKLEEVYHKQIDAEIASQLETKLQGAEEYLLANKDFDSFDRFYFIKEYINPAFKLFNDAHLQLGIETIYEVRKDMYPLNYLADNIFANDFLNPHYFSISGDKEHQPEKVKLGKILFFDPVLSSNNKRSCASCHNPEKAFTDGQARSLAMDFEGTVLRNAPTLINSVFAERYFYDLRTEKIENQFGHVVTSKLEFNTTYPEIVTKLLKSKEYQKLFANAFQKYGGQISKQTVTEALGAYLKTLTGFNSKFDKNIRGEEKTLTSQEIKGFNLFMGKAVCATCHFPPTFAGLVPPYYGENESEVLGVPATTDTVNAIVDPDLGRLGGRMLEKVEFNTHAFKTVTVRNIELTAPYMHNGVYKTLEEVVDFYNKGGGQGIGINLENQTLPFDNLSLTDEEQQDIIAFMRTLTDTVGLTSKPLQLPQFENDPEWNGREIGGEY